MTLLMLTGSVVFLLLSAYPPIRTLVRGFSDSSVIDSVLGAGDLPGLLYAQVGGFVLAAVAVHAAVGLLAVLLTWLGEKGLMSDPAQRPKIAFLWFVGLVGATTLWAAGTYPRSHAADYYGAIAQAGFGALQAYELVGAALGALALFTLGKALATNLERLRSARTWATAGAAGIVAAVALPGYLDINARAAVHQAQPHVILIGVDSLRLEAIHDPRFAALTPNMRRFLEGARVYEDAVTPFGRTFPAWVSILTGRSPQRNGVVCNLTPRDQLDLGATLGDTLGARGYATYFATDEVRFSNIDESYGFDGIITPTMGAADFLLGQIADIPLVNLVAGTRGGQALFPAIHGNRAVADTYRPEVFVPWVEDAVTFDAPTFLAVHFTAPHWPYHFADAGHEDLEATDDWDRKYEDYRTALQAADVQVGQVLDWLEQEGALDNAIVVLLSDHGEALGQPGDSLLSKVDDADVRRLTVSTYGHGSSVLSATQYEVLLAFRGYGAAARNIDAGNSKMPASLEDIAPTVMALLGQRSRVPMDGIALPVKQGAPLDPGRVRFTETGYNTPRMLAGEINPKWLALESAHNYLVNADSAYVELKQQAQQQILQLKERAAIDDEWVLAALPTVSGDQLFILARRDGTWAKIVSGMDEHPEVPVLWSALRDRYGDAIRPPALVPRAAATMAQGAG